MSVLAAIATLELVIIGFLVKYLRKQIVDNSALSVECAKKEARITQVKEEFRKAIDGYEKDISEFEKIVETCSPGDLHNAFDELFTARNSN